MKVGVNVAIFEDGEILLTRREDFGVWCMPGGGVDEGESMGEAAVREALEETGIKVKLKRLVGIYSMPEAKAWANLIVVFVAEPVGGVMKKQAGEVVEMRFFPVDNLPENLLFGHRQRILDAVSGVGGSAAWRQHVPFDTVEDRWGLYGLVEKSGLSGIDFYGQNFGFETPEEDRRELE